MNPRLIRLLVCPRCRGDLGIDISDQQGERIVSGTFRCQLCRVEFPIKGGIPRFVPSQDYASTFGFEWKRWRRTQFDTGSRRTSETIFTVSTGVEPRALKGKLVLDAGCGAGRFMEVVARAGAEVVGVDLSLAVEVAQENLGHLPNCHFLQADLLRLPLRAESFDFIFSLGVLHHTPSTKDAFLRLIQALKPGGEIAIWVYPRRRLTETFLYFPDSVNETLAHDVQYRIPPRWSKLAKALSRPFDWITEASSDWERALTTRLPLRWVYWFSHLAIPLYYVYRFPPFYPLRLVTKIAMDRDPEWRVLHTFDWYSPRFQWKHTFPEVQSWFEEAGIQEVARLPRPVAVRGKKGFLGS